MRRKLLGGLLLASALLALAACGGKPAEGITVQDAWVRPAPMEGGNGAAYMMITNGGAEDDALLGVSADFADRVEVHETFTTGAEESGEGMGDTGDMEGMEGGEMMGMRPVESITIPAGGSVTLEPGGYHVMLLGVQQVFDEGDTVTLTLTFQNAGEVTVEAPVRRE
jgi:copper(I)-binding protein